MMDLVRLSPKPLLPSGGPGIYRQIAELTGMEEGEECLVTPCGSGRSLELLVREMGVQGSGADPDPGLVDEGRARARIEELHGRIQYETAPSDNLPYRDEVFDVVLAEAGLTARADPSDAVRELVRVTRAGGRVALVQPVWTGAVDAERRQRVGRQLGVQALLLTQWKALLRDAGVENLHSESWSEEGPGTEAGAEAPFPDFADLLGVRDKLGMLRRAWARWGARGIYRALVREAEVHRLLARERLLGLSLIVGHKARVPVGSQPSAGPEPAPDVVAPPSPQWAGSQEASGPFPSHHPAP